MRKPMSLLGAVVLLSAVATEVSATETTGVIKTIDPKASAITFSNGQQYEIGPNLKLDSFKSGDKVKVTFSMSGKKRMVSKVEAAK